MSGFFAMGGYAAYVWPAYGVSAAALIAAVAFTLRDYARAQKQLTSAQGEARKP